MQNFDILIAVGQVRRINANGSFFRYYNGSAAGMDESILVTYNGGSVALKAGQSIKLPTSVSEWLVSNHKGQASIVGVVVIGDGEITDTSIAGSVSIIDGGVARSESGCAFLASGPAGSIAGNFSHVQLWNAVGTGKSLILEAIGFSAQAAVTLGIFKDVVPRAVWYQQAANKKFGGAAGGAAVRNEYNAISQGSGVNMLSISLAAGGSSVVNFKEPVIIGEGYGLTIVASVVNLGFSANFEFYER